MRAVSILSRRGKAAVIDHQLRKLSRLNGPARQRAPRKQGSLIERVVVQKPAVMAVAANMLRRLASRALRQPKLSNQLSTVREFSKRAVLHDGAGSTSSTSASSNSGFGGWLAVGISTALVAVTGVGIFALGTLNTLLLDLSSINPELGVSRWLSRSNAQA